jgi:hypothetical protein
VVQCLGLTPPRLGAIVSNCSALRTLSFPAFSIFVTSSNNSSIVECIFVNAVTFLTSRCLATIGEFLPSRCLVTMGGYTDTHTHTKAAVT